MIPTAVTSPPGGAAILGFICNNSNDGNISILNSTATTIANTTTNSNNNNTNLQNATMLGIASLILEGRAFSDEECPLLSLTNELMCNVHESSRQSPKPSTSREAFTNIIKDSSEMNSYLVTKLNSSNSPDLILKKASTTANFDSTDSRWTQKLSQLKQESPLIHASCTEQRVIDYSSFLEPEHAALAMNTAHSIDRFADDDDDFEIIRRIAINRINMYSAPAKTKEHTIGVRTNALNFSRRDGCMSSLQSLATSTCLRVGAPLLNRTDECNSKASTTYIANSNTAGDIINMKKIGFSSGILFGAGNDTIGQGNKSQFRLKSKPSNYLQSPTSTSTSTSTSTTTAISTSILRKAAVEWSDQINPVANRGGEPCSSSCLQRQASTVAHPIIRVAKPNSANSNANGNGHANANANPNTNATLTTRIALHKQGPHCDQFLRKMGLIKGGDLMDYEEHYCDMSYVNITCSRWRAYCLKMESIMAREEPVCIEVYLGPVGDKILLEQWIITVKEKQPPPTMTLPSLCSAIRSQLYFSQISAWCDLIKKSDKTIQDTGRFIFSTTNVNAAGDLATVRKSTNITNSTSSSVTGYNHNRIRLNIFYRIKQYDSTACFNSKPNVHNFPNVNISEDLCISVCLKSLPRISGGIPPKVGIYPLKTPAVISSMAAVTNATNPLTALNENINCDIVQQEQPTMPANTTQSIASANVTSTITTTTTTVAMDNLQNYQKTNEAQQDVLNYINASEQVDGGSSCFDGDSSNSSFSTNFTNLSHREKQLLKYRKRMLKRDKIQRIRDHHVNDLADNHMTSALSSNFCFNLLQSMDQGDEGDDEDELRLIDQTNITSSAKPTTTTSIDQRKHMPNMNINNNNNNSKIIQTSIEAAGKPIQMISTGTQTSTNSCRNCGNEKLLICLTCSSKQCESHSNHSRSISKSNNKNRSVNQRSRNKKGCHNRSNRRINNANPNEHHCSNNITNKIHMDSIQDEVNVDSSASSFSSSDIIRVPCTKGELLLQAIQRTPKKAKKSNRKTKIMTAHEDQCVALNNPNNVINSSSNCSTNGITNNGSTATDCNTNNVVNSNASGCQVCKRQKTQHDFSPLQIFNDNLSSDRCSTIQILPARTISTVPDTISIAVTSATTTTSPIIPYNEAKDSEISIEIKCMDENNDNDFSGNNSDEFSPVSCNTFTMQSYREKDPQANSNDVMEEECYETSTKLTPYIERCILSHKTHTTPNQYSSNNDSNLNIRDEVASDTISPQSNYSNNSYRYENTGDCVAGDTENANNIMDKTSLQYFKTPKSANPSAAFLFANHISVPPVQPNKKIFKPNLLPIVHNYQNIEKNLTHYSSSINLPTNITPVNPNPILFRRNLPKVNLTPIFCNTSATINNSFTNANFATNVSVAIVPSISPTSPCRSPSAIKSPNQASCHSVASRFYKASTVYKRRSRHLSERSDRSSLGSDEQFSDEDTESGLCSPFATSPLKVPTHLSTLFERKPLLGNLEESLLQRRFAPKVEVLGFKLLLGASGGFCPTQLSIPASAYFYELQGDTLNTPYVCEVRLPRKGYTIPRFGTVQATLLNPMGTVVRMFVIPYDMRDMPALHQTFVRQRILADSRIRSPNNANNNICGGNADSNAIITLPTTAELEQQPRYHHSPSIRNESRLGHFISAECMKSLRYSIHLRFQTSRSGRLMLHTDVRLLIARRTDCDTAAAHTKGILEPTNELIIDTVTPHNPKYSARQQTTNKI